MMNVTVEMLTKAFEEWDINAASGHWEPSSDAKYNAVARAKYLMELLENNS